jgi:3-oxoadipate enol-lactonase
MKVDAGGVELAYDARGTGPTLVLLHGFPVDRRMWTETAERLAARFRVLTLDFRGFGESATRSPSSEPPSLLTLADDVAALLDAEGAPVAAIGGLSMGGYVALAFAARHPARLSALILADTRAAADSPDAKRARDDGIARLRAGDAAAFLAPMPDKLLSPRAPAALRDQVGALAAAQSPEALAWALAAMRDRPDRSDGVRGLRCPTLVVVGSDDAITPPAEAAALRATIPGARLVELPGAGHLSGLEAPAAFSAAVGEFLDDVIAD